MISAFIERVVALPDVDNLLLIYDGFSYAKASVIRAWQHAEPTAAAVPPTGP